MLSLPQQLPRPFVRHARRECRAASCVVRFTVHDTEGPLLKLSQFVKLKFPASARAQIVDKNSVKCSTCVKFINQCWLSSSTLCFNKQLLGSKWCAIVV